MRYSFYFNNNQKQISFGIDSLSYMKIVSEIPLLYNNKTLPIDIELFKNLDTFNSAQDLYMKMIKNNGKKYPLRLISKRLKFWYQKKLLISREDFEKRFSKEFK